MRGRAVFYPIGWDDNGLPTERRVQNYFHVQCDPALPYDPAFVPPGRPAGDPVRISRRNFTELCERLTDLDEQAFEQVWRRLGLSVDWSAQYRTIGEVARAVSQREFLRNLARGEAYLAEAPALWDVAFRTAVAQAELEDREVAGRYFRLAFRGPDGAPVPVATTRPELLPACVALVAHPDDQRHAALAGATVTTPLFGVPVPVLTHRLADPGKGTGIAMVCTFGDMADVTWWRDLDLPARPVLGPDGRLLATPPAAITSRPGRAAYRQLAGATLAEARQRTEALARASGDLLGEPEPVTHPVKFYEKGDTPLEIITTRQWYLRNGGRDDGLRAALTGCGREISWHPEYMRVRYENWVDGLTGDWLVSRQRYFGVPIPVWYPLDGDGQPRYDQPIPAQDSALPVDPAAEPPPGYAPAQRGQPGGFAADPDVLDTWATSSLTPRIAAASAPGVSLDQIYPMDMRPQAHEIIRTWLFYTVLRAYLADGSVPWRHAAISGWILDPDRKKMSKSRGNVVTPMDSLRRHGSDAARYWAASGRLGTDMVFDPAQLRVGRRLAIKILNASRFILSLGAGPGNGSAGPGGRPPGPPDSRPAPRPAEPAVATRPARSPISWTGPCWGGWPAWWRPARPRSRTTTTPGHCARRSRSSGSSATTTWSWSSRAATGSTAPRLLTRPSPRCALRCPCCSGCSRRYCRSSPRKCGPGGRTGPSTGPRGPIRPSCGRWPAGPTWPCWPPPRRPSARCAGPSQRPGCPCGPRSASWSSRPGRTAWPGSAPCWATSRRRARWNR